MSKRPKVIFCVPFLDRPTAPFIAALEASVPLIEAAGWDHGLVQEVGNVYISQARSQLLRKACNGEPDCVVFLDFDLSWDAAALLKLIQCEADVVGGTYRFKVEGPDDFMGRAMTDDDGRTTYPIGGLLKMRCMPAGFLKVTWKAINDFMAAYPSLVYGSPAYPYLDLFNHGAIDGVWHGEDYAFSKRWREMGRDLFCIPDINITHHSSTTAYAGNYHDFLQRLPGGLMDPNRAIAMRKVLKPEVQAYYDKIKSELNDQPHMEEAA